jgi:hypothetical protein
VASLAAVVAIARQSLWWGASSGRWIYDYFRAFAPELLAPASAAVAIVVGLAFLTPWLLRRSEWLAVTAWLSGGLAADLLAHAYANRPLGNAVTRDATNGFYSPTREFGALELMRNYRELMDSLPLHAQTNMPGKILLYYVLRLFTDAPDLLGVLVVVVSGLGGLLLYLAVRDLFGDRRVAVYSLALYLLVPGKVYFFPVLNTVSPVPILACFLVFTRYLRTRRRVYALGLGVTLYALVLFEPLPLAMGLLFAALLGAGVWRGAVTRREAALLVGLAAAAFLVVHLAMRLVLQFDLVGLFRHLLAEAQAFNETSRRRYDIWVRQNLMDFALGAGVASVVVAAAGLGVALRGGARSLKERLTRTETVWAASILAILAVLDLLGVSRGEVVRLWIFLACFLQVVPAWLLAQARAPWPLALLAGCQVLQAAIGSAMVEFL